MTQSAAIEVYPEGAHSEIPQPTAEEQFDQYGRLASERTIELSPADAEAINTEVADGRWQAYDDALHYVIVRGLAEIKRTRDAARKLVEKTVLKQTQARYQSILGANPALITNEQFRNTMLAELGVLPKGK